LPANHMADATVREFTLDDIRNSSRTFIRRCVLNRWLFAKWIATCVGCMLVYAFGSTPEYEVTTKVLPYRSERSALGGLSGLAGLAGVSIPMGSSAQVVPSELYPEVASSMAFRVELAERPIQFSNGRYSYLTFFDSIYQPSAVELFSRYVLKAPFTAYASLRSSLSPAADAGLSKSALIDSLGIRTFPAGIVETLDGMKDRVSTVLNKRNGIISVTVRMPDPLAAADLARQTAEQLTAAIIKHESRKASEQARFLGEEQRVATARFHAAQRAFAEFRDRNKSLNSAVRSIELQRLESELTLASELYRGITTQYEAARVDEREDTPVFTVLEPSVVPNRPSSPRKLRLVALALLLGVMIPGSWVLFSLASATGRGMEFDQPRD
jgi:uncharacterized protein involved in exopolysaccharide biosynthesis